MSCSELNRFREQTSGIHSFFENNEGYVETHDDGYVYNFEWDDGQFEMQAAIHQLSLKGSNAICFDRSLYLNPIADLIVVLVVKTVVIVVPEKRKLRHPKQPQ